MNEIPTPLLWWEFFNPERLWAVLLVPVLLIVYLILLRLKRNRGMRYTQTGIVATVLPKQSKWRRHISVLMTLSSLIAISGAWARPVGMEQVPRERATIVVVLDRSLSMEATDVLPNRFDASKQAAKNFIKQLPAKYNVAIVGLSGSPALLAPPTTDRQLISRVIDQMTLQDGTAIGEAINIALSAIAMAPAGDAKNSKPAPGMILMLSDGQNTSEHGDVAGAVHKAAEQKIPIYTIAYGTQNGYVDMDGKRYNVAPDLPAMQQISQATGAISLDAASADQLNNVYERMGSEMGYEEKKTEVTATWALYAAAFAIVAAVGAVSMAARWP